MKRLECSILIGLVAAAFLGGMTGFAQRCDTVRHDTVRLHILANSDSQEDQALKLKVRDAVLERTADVFLSAPSQEQAVQRAREHLPEIIAVAQQTLRENGCNDPVSAQVIEMFFPTRQYGGVIMPAGRYDAVRILIGEGKGHNWWCVMFPPMCLPAAQEQEEPLEGARKAQGELIPAQPEYKVKFAVVELYERAKEKWKELFGREEAPFEQEQEDAM